MEILVGFICGVVLFEKGHIPHLHNDKPRIHTWRWWWWHLVRNRGFVEFKVCLLNFLFMSLYLSPSVCVCVRGFHKGHMHLEPVILPSSSSNVWITQKNTCIKIYGQWHLIIERLTYGFLWNIFLVQTTVWCFQISNEKQKMYHQCDNNSSWEDSLFTYSNNKHNQNVWFFMNFSVFVARSNKQTEEKKMYSKKSGLMYESGVFLNELVSMIKWMNVWLGRCIEWLGKHYIQAIHIPWVWMNECSSHSHHCCCPNVQRQPSAPNIFFFFTFECNLPSRYWEM